MRQSERNQPRVMLDLLAGAAGGALATWVMGKATSYLYEHESQAARGQEDAARGGKTAYGVAAEKAARAAGRDLTDAERKRYGNEIHWALGIGAGALYGVLRERVPQTRLARGLAFGLAFWLVVDEGANYLLGLTPGPSQFPWQTHARGLAGHLTYGAVADATLTAVRAAA